MKTGFRFLFSLLLAANTLTAALASDTKPVSQSQVIDQPSHVVWLAIQSLRTSDREHRKLVSYTNGEAIIEEKFRSLPIVGDASCKYKECELPPNEIDYSLISSDQFKVFEGRWMLTPLKDGTTMVSLSANFDTGLRIPFWREITKNQTNSSLKRRLKQLSEEADHLASEQASAALPSH
jgi:ribosome-associated toxin RatA of RatAB toxin-antitoxin module